MRGPLASAEKIPEPLNVQPLGSTGNDDDCFDAEAKSKAIANGWAIEMLPIDNDYWKARSHIDIGHGVKYPYSICALLNMIGAPVEGGGDDADMALLRDEVLK